MSDNLEDLYAVKICLERLLKSQKEVLQYVTNTDSIDNGYEYINNCCQELKEAYERCETWHQSILPQNHRLLQLPLHIFKRQHYMHGYLYQLFKERNFQTFWRTLDQQIAINTEFITVLTNYELDIRISHFDDFSEELDYDGGGESDVYEVDEMNEDELDELGKSGMLGALCEAGDISAKELVGHQKGRGCYILDA